MTCPTYEHIVYLDDRADDRGLLGGAAGVMAAPGDLAARFGISERAAFRIVKAWRDTLSRDPRPLRVTRAVARWREIQSLPDYRKSVM